MSNVPTEKPPTPSKREMRQWITSLRPDSELYAGRKFFERLLEQQGVEGVLAFMEKASIALDKQAELDLHYDFTPAEREVFDKSRLKYLSRRSLLSILPGAYFAGVAMTSGAFAVEDQVSMASTGKHDTGAQKRHQWVTDTLGPSAELAVGVLVAHETYEVLLKEKLEQIADAIEELSQKWAKKTVRDADHLSR